MKEYKCFYSFSKLLDALSTHYGFDGISSAMCFAFVCLRKKKEDVDRFCI